MKKYRRLNLFLVFAIVTFSFSCIHKVDNKNLSPEEIGFNALSAIKKHDRQKLNELCDQAAFANTPASQLDSFFVFWETTLDKYELPEIEVWKANRTICQFDTVNRILSIGLPLTMKRNGSIDYVVSMQLSPTNKIAGLRMEKLVNPNDIPESDFPPKEEAFHYSTDSLKSIRLYYLPGVNSNIKLSKSVILTDKQFDGVTNTDFGSLLAQLNVSQIQGAEKIAPQQSETNNLKAIIFVYSDKGRERNLYLLSNDVKERSLEVNVFYVVNATYSYQLSEPDNASLKEMIDRLIDKYVK